MLRKIFVITLLAGTLARNVPNADDQWVSKIVDSNFGLRTSNVEHSPDFHHDSNMFQMHRRHDIERGDEDTQFPQNREDSIKNAHRVVRFNDRTNDTRNRRRLETGFTNQDSNENSNVLRNNQRITIKPFVSNLDKSNKDEKVKYTTRNMASDESYIFRSNDESFPTLTNNNSYMVNNVDVTSNNMNFVNNLNKTNGMSFLNSNQERNSTNSNSATNLNRNVVETNRTPNVANLKNNTNNDNIKINKNVYDGILYTESKSTTDNEVIPRTTTYKASTQSSVDQDRWIWDDGKTTTPGLGDRAAFSGDKCPTGKAKLGNMCVDRA